MKKNALPIVYSCSGCSNLAQTANQVALLLNQEKHAEMSCIAGVGGKVKKLVNQAKSAQTIIALDGCPLHCVKQCLAQHELMPDIHMTLTDLGLKKRYNIQADAEDITFVKQAVLDSITASNSNNKLDPVAELKTG